jgi:predicted DNA-binding transcriptional regulator AlpA
MNRERNSPRVLPRLIRFRDVAAYLGMDRNRFNQEVRPYLTEIRIGRQGIAFDRLELDDWVDQYVACNGRPGRLQGVRPWDDENRPDSSRERAFGTSTNGSKGKEFAKALARLSSRKPSAT